MNVTALTILLLFIATHRITRLIVEDKIPLMKWPRDKICDYLDPQGSEQYKHSLAAAPGSPWGLFGESIAYLLTCPWCMSVWVGAGLTWLVAATSGIHLPWSTWVLVAASASSITGFLAEREK